MCMCVCYMKGSYFFACKDTLTELKKQNFPHTKSQIFASLSKFMLDISCVNNSELKGQIMNNVCKQYLGKFKSHSSLLLPHCVQKRYDNITAASAKQGMLNDVILCCLAKVSFSAR
jgi:hypothetical protein